jgi:protein translocase SEC61 complex gamma subunit
MGFGNMMERIKRVFMVATKPDTNEYRQSLKITSIGIMLIGVIGFAIFIAVQLMGGL